MTGQTNPCLHAGGFSLAEVMVAVAIFGIITAASISMYMSMNNQMAAMQAKFGKLTLATDLRAVFENPDICKESYIGQTLPNPDASNSIPLSFKLPTGVAVASAVDLTRAYQVKITSLGLQRVTYVGTSWAGNPVYSGAVLLSTSGGPKSLQQAPTLIGALFLELKSDRTLVSCSNYPMPLATLGSGGGGSSKTSTTSTSTSTPASGAATTDAIPSSAALSAAVSAATAALANAMPASVPSSNDASATSNANGTESSACTTGQTRIVQGKCGQANEVCLNGNWFSTDLSDPDAPCAQSQ